MATIPYDFSVEDTPWYSLPQNLRPNEEQFSMAQSDPVQYNANVISYLNDTRNEMLRGGVYGSRIGQVDDAIKSISEQAKDPSIYYKAKLDFIANNIGRNTAMGEDTSSWVKQLQDIVPSAIQNGVPIDSLQNLLDSSYNAGQGRGSYQKSTNWENVGGAINKYGYLAPLLVVAPALAAEFGAGAVGAAGVGEGVAAGAGAAGVGEGALTTAEILGSSGFTPAAGSSFAIAPGAAYTAGGALTTGEILGTSGFTPVGGASFGVDPLTTYGAVASEAVPFVPEPAPYVPEPAPYVPEPTPYVPETNPFVAEPAPYVPEPTPYVTEPNPFIPEPAPFAPEPTPYAFETPYAPETPQLTTSEILNSTGFTPTAETPFTVDPSAAYTTGATTSIPADIGMGTDAPLQGPTYQELGVTGVPEGGMGPTYGEMGYTGINNAEASAAADAAAQQSQLSEALKTANQVRQVASTANNLAKLLSPVAKTVAKTGTNANSQFINAAQNLAQFTPEQFGGYYQMNKNPFTFSNPMANALKNKDATGLDVSGTGGQALNTTNQIANLLRTLA
jgi:hypothetical protein